MNTSSWGATCKRELIIASYQSRSENRRILCLLCIIAFFCCPLNIMAQEGRSQKGYVQLLQKYDFNKGGYSIVGLLLHNQAHELQKTIGSFYTDDIQILNEMKRKWITARPSPFFACGYHFRLFVVRGVQVLESFNINVENGCNTVVTDYGQFYFDPENIRMYRHKFKDPIVKREHFASCQKGRDYIQSLGNNDSLLMYVEPRWKRYDGEFRFEVICNPGDLSGNYRKKCVEDARHRIAKKYSQELFSLEQSGFSDEHILITMKCSKELYDDFDIYKISWKWRDYSPELEMVFKNI